MLKRRLVDLYLLLAVFAGGWIWAANDYAAGPRGGHLMGYVVLLAAAGWFASAAGGNSLVQLLVRSVAVIGVTAIVIAMAVSVPGAG